MKKIYLSLVAMLFAITSFGKSLTADFTTGNGGAITWDSSTETMAWTAGWDNWINVFNFGTTGDLKNYTTLKFTVSDLVANYRIILKGANDANLATLDNQSATGDIEIVFANNDAFKSVDLSIVERILFAGRGDSGSMVLKNVVIEDKGGAQPEPEPTYQVPAGSTDLKDLQGTEPYWASTVIYPKEFAVQGASFGNGDGSNESTHVDISEYEKLSFIVTNSSTGLALRVWIWDEEKNKVVTLYAYPDAEFATTTNWEQAYLIKNPGVYSVNVADYTHLKGVKANNDWGASPLKVALAYATPKEAIATTSQDKQSLSDAKINLSNTTFDCTINNVTDIALVDEAQNIASICKFDGTIVETAKMTIKNGKISFKLTNNLPAGDYNIIIPNNTLKINGQAYDTLLESMLAVGVKNQAAKDAQKALENELAEAQNLIDNMVSGTNLFQYAPVTKGQMADNIQEARDLGDFLVEEEHVYNVITVFRKYLKGIRPILPKVDRKYAIKHQATGLYLSLDGDKVTLQKEPYPIQFHLVDASTGMTNKGGSYLESAYTDHYTYIYSTKDRLYLGYNATPMNNGSSNYTIETTNKKNSVWAIYAMSTNAYTIVTSPDHNNQNLEDALFASDTSKEGANVTCVDGNVRLKNPLEIEWYIENYDVPEEPEAPETPEVDNSLIEIAQSQGKELDTFARTELVEGNEYNTYTAKGDLQIAIKMEKVDVKGCDYVVIKFAEPVKAGWQLAFWSNQDLVPIPEGATEYKYVFAEDAKCGITNGVLPQICMMTFFGAPNPLEAKVTGLYKHVAEGGSNDSSFEATAINSTSTTAKVAAIYDASGARINAIKKGINIVKMSDGSVKKVIK